MAAEKAARTAVFNPVDLGPDHLTGTFTLSTFVILVM